ncbi:MAG: Uncharacterized protein FD135_3515 [Comamonadaceae bacterium]|nr:MAG: Uncharacterized protein FD135_3515 [Comamonadaceae bacterium]
MTFLNPLHPPPVQPTQPVREVGHDLLKGVAVLLMIQVHVMELLATQSVMDGLAGKVSLFLGGAPVAPVFLLLFGFYALRAPVWPGRLLWRGLKLLLLGLLLNLGMNIHLLTRIGQGQLALDPWRYLLGVDILLLAGLSLIAITWLRPLLKEHAWAWLLASLSVAAVSPWVGQWMSEWAGGESGWQWLAAFVGLPAPWSFFPLFPWLAYPLLGVAAFYGRSRLHLSPPWRKPLLAAVLLGLLLTGPFAVATSHQLSAYYHHDLRFFLWASLLALCWALLLPRLGLPQRVTTWLAWWGQHVTACYVLQWLLIGNLATAIYKTQSLGACLLWFVALVLLTRWGVQFLAPKPLKLK